MMSHAASRYDHYKKQLGSRYFCDQKTLLPVCSLMKTKSTLLFYVEVYSAPWSFAIFQSVL